MDLLTPLPRPSKRHAGPPGEAPRPVRGDRREVLFTFDDGPDLEGTPKVLELLAAHGVQGVFFVNGQMLIGERPPARARRALLRQLVSEGHVVGNHTVDHLNVCRDDVDIEAQVTANGDLLAAATGARPVCSDPPMGPAVKS